MKPFLAALVLLTFSGLASAQHTLDVKLTFKTSGYTGVAIKDYFVPSAIANMKFVFNAEGCRITAPFKWSYRTVDVGIFSSKREATVTTSIDCHDKMSFSASAGKFEIDDEDESTYTFTMKNFKYGKVERYKFLGTVQQ